MTRKLAWDDFWMLLAANYSTRGSCDRLRVACLLVKNKRLVSAGYNGSVSGLEDCDDAGHLMRDGHCKRTIHSERNAIDNALTSDLEGAIAYVTARPCLDCAKCLLQKGIKRIIYVDFYDNAENNDLVADFCKQKEVEYKKFADNPEIIAQLFEKALDRLGEQGGLFHEMRG